MVDGQTRPGRFFFFVWTAAFFLAFTDDEGVPRNVCTQHWTLTTVPVLSLKITVSSCVVQIVCVITNQGSSNPNCLNFLKDAYKVYQGVPPTYWTAAAWAGFFWSPFNREKSWNSNWWCRRASERLPITVFLWPTKSSPSVSIFFWKVKRLNKWRWDKNANIPINTHERVVWTDIATTSSKWTYKQVFALSLQIRTRETIKWDTKDGDVKENNLWTGNVFGCLFTRCFYNISVFCVSFYRFSCTYLKRKGEIKTCLYVHLLKVKK